MADCTHYVGLMTVLIDGVAHCFAVDCKAFVIFPMGFVPVLQGTVGIQWIDTNKNISDDVLTWNDVAAMFTAAPETLTGLLAKSVCPVRDGSISSHPTQNCARCNGEDGGKSMASALYAAGIRDLGEKVRQ